MKLLSNLCKNFIASLPRFSEGQKVTHVWNKGFFDTLDFPTLHSDISCPICSAKEGYLVKDGKNANFAGWSCKNEVCIEYANLTKPSYLNGKNIRILAHRSIVELGVPEILEHANFSDMKQTAEIKNKLKTFCDKFSGFLLLPGSSGTGKSYASVCCMKKYLQSHESAYFLNVADLFVTWLGLKQSGQSELTLLHKYSECGLLILDDLGTRTPSESFLDFIYLIVNKRAGKLSAPTIITTNLNYQELAQKVGDPILSRISSGVIAKFSGEDRRKPKF